MTRDRILLVEDNLETQALLLRYLGAAGFECTSASDGRSGLRAAAEEKPDLVLLDVMRPELDGLAVCRRLRRDVGLPVILLTARAEEMDRIQGLEFGADDYVTKPFSPRELVARIRAVLRRTRHPNEPARIECGGLVLDVEGRRAWFGDEDLELTRSEFDLLWTLAARPGRVCARDELHERTAREGGLASGRAVDTHVANLRRKLCAARDDGADPPVGTVEVQTVYGVGYRLVTEGRVADDAHDRTGTRTP